MNEIGKEVIEEVVRQFRLSLEQQVVLGVDLANGPDYSAMGLFDGVNGQAATYAMPNYNTNTSDSVFSIDDIKKCMELMPPGPTEEQIKFARDRGYETWDGIKVSPKLYRQLKDEYGWRPSPSGQYMVPHSFGCPLIVDHTFKDLQFMTAKQHWEIEQKAQETAKKAMDFKLFQYEPESPKYRRIHGWYEKFPLTTSAVVTMSREEFIEATRPEVASERENNNE